MLGIGIFGLNGHQVHKHLVNHPDARLVAASGADQARLASAVEGVPDVAIYDTLDELLQDERVQVVSLCSPRRADQAAQAVQCLEAGRHVYAEKPCAPTEEELDRILKVAQQTGCKFHEMAGTRFSQPYAAMAKVVRDGRIGEVVQVFAQKSYPNHGNRPQDEAVDGGLIAQAGVHAARMVEHVAGVPVASVVAIDTKLASPDPAGELRMAATIMMQLENKGLATIIANYLNPGGTGVWGNEYLHIFGTKGVLESRLRDKHTRLYVGGEDLGPLDTDQPRQDYFDFMLNEVLGKADMPLSLEQELHPTRIVLRARDSARAAGQWITKP